MKISDLCCLSIAVLPLASRLDEEEGKAIACGTPFPKLDVKNFVEKKTTQNTNWESPVLEFCVVRKKDEGHLKSRRVNPNVQRLKLARVAARNLNISFTRHNRPRG